MLRPSLYTRLIKLTETDALLLNIPRRSADITTLDFGKRMIDNPSIINSSQLIKLLNCGYLVETSPQEEIEWFVKYVNSIQTACKPEASPIAIIITNTCDLCCPYCFESNNKKKRSAIISRNQAEKVMSYIKGISPNVSHIELYGGEPLSPQTKPVIEYIVNEAYSLGLTTRVTTNGVYLENFYHIIKSDKINFIQITLDGSARFHNKRRVNKNGDPTFSTILENIKYAIKNNVIVYLRSNIDRSNLTGLVELIELLDKEKILYSKNLIFNYINVKKNEEAKGFNWDHLMKQIEIDKYLYNIASTNKCIANFLNTKPSFSEFLKNIIDTPKLTYCGACSSNIYFSLDNCVYNCHEHVDNPKYSIGSFDGHKINFNDLQKKWRSRSVSNLDNCKKCSLALVHGGGCGAGIVKTQDLCTTGNCSSFSEDFDEYVRLQYNKKF